jgi:proteasome lid subunit RPN8/RPN11
MKLKLSSHDLRAIHEHALENFPRECCGLLLGKFRKDIIEVGEIIKAENVLGSPTAFEVDAELVFKAIERSEKSGLELVGIYHSHPNIRAYVSGRDAEIMKLWPGVAWLILSVTQRGVVERKVYTLKEEKIAELELIVG